MTEQELHDYNKWLVEVWSKNIRIPFQSDAPRAYLSYKDKLGIDVYRSDYIMYQRPEIEERTRERLIQINELGMKETGIASFGLEGVMSGLYIETVWAYSDEEWDEYINYIKHLSKI